MVLLLNTCLNCSFLHQLGRLVTVSDPLTATSSSFRQSNCLHMDGVFLVFQAQLFGTACGLSQRPHIIPWFVQALSQNLPLCMLLINSRHHSALGTLWLYALYKFFIVLYCIVSPTERASLSAHFRLPWVRPWDNRGKYYSIYLSSTVYEL